ncbi:hypothetical protein ACWDA7_20970 [Streptomyces sp. NPDC001156]
MTISTIAGDDTDRRGVGGPAAGLDLRQGVPIADGKNVLGDNHGVAVDATGTIYVAATANSVVGRISAPTTWTDHVLDDGFNQPTSALLWKVIAATGQAHYTLELTTVDGHSAIRWIGTDVMRNTWLYAVPNVLAGATVDCSVSLRGSGTVYLDFYNGAKDVTTAPVVLTESPQTLRLTTTVSGTNCQFQIRTPSAQPTVDVTVWDVTVHQHQITGATWPVAGVMNSLGYDDQLPALKSHLNHPHGVAADARGNVYIADTYNHRVRLIGRDGRIRTVVGNGVAARSGDSGPAAEASLNAPHGVDMDDAGTLYIADTLNNIVRTVRDGVMNTVAGTGLFGTTGRSGGPALSATLAGPFDVAVDRDNGDLYIVEGSQAVLRVTALS